MTFLTDATRNIFFAGADGVGKSAVACAAAIALADTGKRVLLVSTSPALHLDEVLQTNLRLNPTSVHSVPGLYAMRLDLAAAAAKHCEQLVAPYRGRLSAETLSKLQVQFSNANSTAIAVFDEFARLLGNPIVAIEFDHVLFDAAPSGHALRMIALAADRHRWILEQFEGNPDHRAELHPRWGSGGDRIVQSRALETLRRRTATTLVLMTRPEIAPLLEAEQIRQELALHGIGNQHLLINGLRRIGPADVVCADTAEWQFEQAFQLTTPRLAELPRTLLPLCCFNLIGVTALRRFMNATLDEIENQGPGRDDGFDIT